MNAHVVIYCDNINSILLANNLVYHARTKHIEVHYHFIREKVLAKEIDFRYRQAEEISKNAWYTRSGFELEGNVENSSSTS